LDLTSSDGSLTLTGNSSTNTVNFQLSAALQTAISTNTTNVAANTTAIAGKVSKTGDTMSGRLAITNSTAGVTGTASSVVTGDANTVGFIVQGTTNPAVLPTNTFYASYVSSTTADSSSGSGTLTADVGSPTVSSGRLDMTGNSKRAHYASASNVPLTTSQPVTIQLKVTPNYNGSPGNFRCFWSLANSGNSNSRIMVGHNTSGHIAVLGFSTASAAGVVVVDCGAWGQVSGTTYEVEVSVDLTGTLRVFLDGTLIGTNTNMTAVGITACASNFYVGSTNDDFGDFYLDDIMVTTGIRHTANYVAPTVYGTAVAQAADLMRWNSPTTTLAKVDANGNFTAPSVIVSGATASKVAVLDSSKSVASSGIDSVTLSSALDPSLGSTFFDDFISASGGMAGAWANAVTGTGATMSVTGSAIATNRPGILICSGGTTATGIATLRQSFLAMAYSGGQAIFQAPVQVATLSAAADCEYVFRIGVETSSLRRLTRMTACGLSTTAPQTATSGSSARPPTAPEPAR
jgi:hypothetical protein